ncbi:DNA-binding protein [Vibrio parahaemolyticus]|uniref:H-NS family histone-like protein n=1 Tax=Vibrio parahaemolyticus TaxID=670 RepID=UPI00111F448A|nr:H-NS family nucleoid-associated regulatory protein [Vibrio parahaemolyticus]TOM58302.1 DNA-binding protein [Vibrio parahaemolyticus]TOM64882.1 DNA-binding protein [Vibrio parahaemolyticus]TOM73579.1 DNA-binding protein [Vibrio parahaemolyticus]TOM97319.1 DNA-binding protein [Vibrio parahaemolyticus]
MQDIIKKLSNPRQAKTVLKHASVEQLERVLNVITEFKEEKELEAQMQAEREQQERQELEAMREQIINKGLDFDKLCDLMKPKKKPRKASKSDTNTPSNTYVYGDNKTWNGVGEVPTELQSLLDEGFELSDFIAQS